MVKLQTSVVGSGSQNLVLLHGWGMGAAVWQVLIPLLSERYSLHVVDLPGYGANVDVEAKDLSEVADLVAASVPDGAVWLGWSLGGMVSLQVVEKSPGKVAGLILVASSPCFTQSDDWNHAMAPKQLAAFADGLFSDLKGTLKRFVALQFYGMEGVRDLSRGLQKKVVERPVASSALEQGLQFLESEDLRSAYAGLSMPVKHVHGSMDRLVPVKVVSDLEALNPEVEQVVMNGVGHAPFVSHPELFIERLGL